MRKKVECIGSSPESIQTARILRSDTPEGRENEIIDMVYEKVAQRIQNGEATSAEYVHFLKMGSARERLEKEKLEVEMELQRVKAEAIESAKSMEELSVKAIEAMKSYVYMSFEGEEL